MATSCLHRDILDMAAAVPAPAASAAVPAPAASAASAAPSAASVQGVAAALLQTTGCC